MANVETISLKKQHAKHLFADLHSSDEPKTGLKLFYHTDDRWRLKCLYKTASNAKKVHKRLEGTPDKIMKIYTEISASLTSSTSIE